MARFSKAVNHSSPCLSKLTSMMAVTPCPRYCPNLLADKIATSFSIQPSFLRRLVRLRQVGGEMLSFSANAMLLMLASVCKMAKSFKSVASSELPSWGFKLDMQRN
jgi:hypothetical protein